CVGGSISWSNGSTGNSISVPSGTAGTYSFTATCKVTTNNKECSATDAGTVTVNPPVTVSVNDIVICTGETSTLTATGCAGTVSWTGGGTPNGNSLSVNAAGTYTAICKVTLNGKECSASDAGTVIVNPPVTVSVNDIVLCDGETGTLTATGCNGRISWSNGATTNTITVTTAGTYTATCFVTINNKECSGSDAGTVIVNPPVTVSVNDIIVCAGETGTLTATGCTGNVTWMGGGTPSGNNLLVNATGTYTATCKVTTNNKECSATDAGTVIVNPVVTVSVSDIVICAGETGTLTANGCSGIVTWSGGGTPNGNTLSVNNPGTYTAICKVSANGKECSASDAGTVTVNPPVTVSVNDLALCAGESGKLIATGCNGTVVWSTGATATSINVSETTAGTYSYTATCYATTNNKTCTASDIATLTINPNPKVKVDDVSICKGASITLTATECTGTVTWNTGVTGVSITVSPTTNTTYTATCTLSTGCKATDTGTVDVLPVLVPTISSNSPVCEGGSINLKADGGTTYSWKGPNGYTSSVQNPVINPATTAHQGIYTVTVTNGSGCTGTATTSVTIKTLPKIVSSNSAVCEGEDLTLTAPDFGAGATYLWTGPNSFSQNGRTVTISNTTSANEGVYTITITKDGCSTSGTVEVDIKNKPTPPSISVDGPNTICDNTPVKLIATGCTGGTVVWSTNQSGTTITVNSEGTYWATCKVGNCSSGTSSSIVIKKGSKPAAPGVTTNKTICCDGATATLTATGCTDGTLNWSTGAVGSTIQVATSGTYTVTCTNSCGTSSNSTPIVIRTGTSPTKPIIATDKDKLCTNEVAHLTATGCNGIVVWSNGMTGTSITVGTTGTYTARCENICGSNDASEVITIKSGDAPNAPVVSPSTTSICANASATLTATGCNGTVVWSNGMTGSSISVSVTGNYSAKCITSCGTSTASNIATVNASEGPSTPNVASDKTILCAGESAILTASNCNGTIVWSTGVTANSITVTSAGTYKAICTTTCGTAEKAIEIKPGTAPLPPTVTADKDICCTGQTVTLTATACSSGVVVWNTGATGNILVVSDSGTYTAVCKNECGQGSSSTPVVIKTLPKPNTPIITTDKTTVCGTEKATLTVSNCNGTLVWNTGATTSTIVVGAGTYSATCENICEKSPVSNIVTITTGTSPDAPTIATDKTSLCNGESATLTATGCTGTVKWSTNATGASITVTTSGTYTATCSNTCGTSVVSNQVIITTGSTPAAPTVTSDKTEICTGHSAVLTATGCTGGSITWTGGSTGSTLTVNTAGTYTATCTTTCGSSSASIVITTKNPPLPPTVTADKDICCTGQTVTLTATACSSGVVVWNTGATGNILVVSDSGTYTAVCKNECGQGSSSTPVVIKTLPKPNTPIITTDKTTVCGTEKATLTVSNCNGTLVWNTGATTSTIVVGAGTYSATC
ncbi:beta strand repeat-containing protein, partial [Emticicia agri]|uniref:beta strand repeat-containing protein n=1 Tax=Emticicia agri TaxID=2492393 RepID=UPI0035B573D2